MSQIKAFLMNRILPVVSIVGQTFSTQYSSVFIGQIKEVTYTHRIRTARWAQWAPSSQWAWKSVTDNRNRSEKQRMWENSNVSPDYGSRGFLLPRFMCSAFHCYFSFSPTWGHWWQILFLTVDTSCFTVDSMQSWHDIWSLLLKLNCNCSDNNVWESDLS